MSKYKYLLKSIGNFLQPKICPFCKQKGSNIIDRKYIFTTLNECENCKLYYRHPLDSVSFNKKFYNTKYSQDDGITTDLPSDNQLENWLKENFKNSSKNADKHIKVLQALMDALNGKKIIDFGATWGYTSFQFKNLGMVTEPFEISKRRAEFGGKLELNIKTDISLLEGDQDVFYSSHVIEHLPDVGHMFNVAKEKLKNDGLQVIFCPNGTTIYKESKFKNFHTSWGEVHPNVINENFVSQAFPNNPYYIDSSPYDHKKIEKWNKENNQVINDLGGDEMVFIVKPNIIIER